jgi:cation transport ATPase
MAQTKRKRQTKHRGNAAGVIEARGRTGRPPSAEEKKRQTKTDAREARLNRQPTWKGAFTRAAMLGPIMFAFLMLTDHPKHGSALLGAFIFAVFAVIIYTPGGFYIETFLWRRRMAKKQKPQRS